MCKNERVKLCNCEHTDETCEYEENVEDLEDDQVVKCQKVKS